MPDKAPELYEKIQRLFEQKFQQDGVIQDLYQLILEGNADYKEAGEFAIRTGELLAQVFETTLSGDRVAGWPTVSQHRPTHSGTHVEGEL